MGLRSFTCPGINILQLFPLLRGMADHGAKRFHADHVAERLDRVVQEDGVLGIFRLKKT